MSLRVHAGLAVPLLGCCLFLCAHTSSENAGPPQAARFKLTWSDEFSGPDGSAPDASRWTRELGVSKNGWGNHELESYTDRAVNSQLRDGHLVITATKEKLVGADGVEMEYTSARLKTQRKFSQAYGRFEARIKIPKGPGMWPAFWMLGADISKVGWPQCGEIDIMENIGNEPGTVHGSLHGPSSVPGRKPGMATSDLTKTLALSPGQKFADDFHLYAVEWEPGAVRFYVDSTLYATFNKAEWPSGGTWVFDHPFFIILNVAVGGDWPGPPDRSTKFPQRMLVDYVRAYEQQ
ncbi:MAG TPA: glycoside hydrolase family 16 protein [Candidatus Saccharimonadales bacterium]|nr:glycoside hydrolase family 16 protein [Candidatus Saccharimonadales bacterium]